MRPSRLFIRLTLIVSALFAWAQTSEATTVEYSASGISMGQPAFADVTITTENNEIVVVFANQEANPTSISQSISGLVLGLGNTPSSVALKQLVRFVGRPVRRNIHLSRRPHHPLERRVVERFRLPGNRWNRRTRRSAIRSDYRSRPLHQGKQLVFELSAANPGHCHILPVGAGCHERDNNQVRQHRIWHDARCSSAGQHREYPGTHISSRAGQRHRRPGPVAAETRRDRLTSRRRPSIGWHGGGWHGVRRGLIPSIGLSYRVDPGLRRQA